MAHQQNVGTGPGIPPQNSRLIRELNQRIGGGRPLPSVPTPKFHRYEDIRPNGTVLPADDVSVLQQQLRTSQRSLERSEKANRQLMREMKRLEERIESMMTLQKLIADRQLRELSDGGSTAALVASTRHDRSHSTTDTTTDTQPGHVTSLTSLRRKLSQRLDAQSTAAIMFQRGALTLRELQAIQASRQQPVSAAEKLIDVVIGQPYEVYERFMDAVKQSKRMDVFDMLVNSGFEGHASTTAHALQIREHYVYLLDTLDTKYSGLLDRLFSSQVLNGREKSDIGQETSSYRQNELLLSSLCYKSEDDYNKFLTALDKTDQGHVRNTITGRTEQQEEKDTGMRDDDDVDETAEMSQTSEMLQLRQQVQQLSAKLNELRLTNASLEQKLKDEHAVQPRTPKRGRTQWPLSPVATLAVGGVVTGVAELQGVIYAVCKDSKAIQSYKTDDCFTRQRDIPVSGLQDACDIVACLGKLRLYVADQQGIWVVSPLSHKVDGRINTSPVRPKSVSVRDGHLLVTSHHSTQLVRYSGDGLEVGRVSLPGNVTPEHAASTPRGTFIVCSRTTSRRKPQGASSEEQHQTMEVSAGGETLRSFGGARGVDSSIHRLNYPWYVVQDEAADQCFVADRNNGRVLHLDAELRPTGAVVDSPQDRPSRLCLAADRLLVGHSDCVDVYVLR